MNKMVISKRVIFNALREVKWWIRIGAFYGLITIPFALFPCLQSFMGAKRAYFFQFIPIYWSTPLAEQMASLVVVIFRKVKYIIIGEPETIIEEIRLISGIRVWTTYVFAIILAVFLGGIIGYLLGTIINVIKVNRSISTRNR